VKHSPVLEIAVRVRITHEVFGFSYGILCIEPSGGIRHPRWDFPRHHFVTPEAKIRQLSTLLLAAENDEAANRILADLRDALHEYYVRLRREVALEMEREYLSSHKEDMAAD
jgi:hypothetical protein